MGGAVNTVPHLPVLSRKGVGWTEALTLIQAFNTAQFPSGIDALRGAPYLVGVNGGGMAALELIRAFNTAQFPSGIDALRGAPYLVRGVGSMGTRAEDLVDFLDRLTVFWMCWPNDFNELTGSAEKVEARLEEQWNGFKAHIKRDQEKLAELESVWRKHIATLKNPETRREGAWGIQAFERDPALRKLR